MGNPILRKILLNAATAKRLPAPLRLLEARGNARRTPNAVAYDFNAVSPKPEEPKSPTLQDLIAREPIGFDAVDRFQVIRGDAHVGIVGFKFIQDFVMYDIRFKEDDGTDSIQFNVGVDLKDIWLRPDETICTAEKIHALGIINRCLSTKDKDSLKTPLYLLEVACLDEDNGHFAVMKTPEHLNAVRARMRLEEYHSILFPEYDHEAEPERVFRGYGYHDSKRHFLVQFNDVYGYFTPAFKVSNKSTDEYWKMMEPGQARTALGTIRSRLDANKKAKLKDDFIELQSAISTATTSTGAYAQMTFY